MRGVAGLQIHVHYVLHMYFIMYMSMHDKDGKTKIYTQRSVYCLHVHVHDKNRGEINDVHVRVRIYRVRH